MLDVHACRVIWSKKKEGAKSWAFTWKILIIKHQNLTSHIHPTSKQSSSTRYHVSTRHKGKEIAKPITPPPESASKEDSDLEQAQRDKEMQKNLALIANYFKKIYKPTNNNLKTFSNTRNKNMDTSPRYKNDNQTGLFRNQRTMTIADARETIGSQLMQQTRIQASYLAKGLAKIQEVPTTDLGPSFDVEPLEEVHSNDDYNVFANEKQHFEQLVSIDNTSVVKKVDSNVIPNSSDMEETLTLKQESRSKLNKDLVKPYDYTKQNSLYENFKPPSWEYLDQLANAKEVRKKM
uniref:Uncharacterized protein n=1 Tax=Tanacetum cinerariifolium TaxID=118510 RepID=A0A699GVW6_TANCI|nr:hypothetical protein [Tanacetum cinerariifolium]